MPLRKIFLDWGRRSMPDVHAILSASSSERWIHCPPSAMLAEQVPQETSESAAAGTVAHSLAEIKAANALLGQPGNAESVRSHPLFDTAMEAATDEYVDALIAERNRFYTTPFISLEQRVEFSYIVPGGFGTADCVMIGDGTITVVDYKNGAGVNVPAVGNTQLRLYAYGAIQTFGNLFGGDFDTVRMVIVQPHAGGVKDWEISQGELLSWAETVVRPAALMAADGRGELTPGTWCESHFCPVRHNCPERAKKMMAAVVKRPAVSPMLTDEELGEILKDADDVRKWLSSIEDYAFKKLMAGEDFPGYKLVLGSSRRGWVDEDKAAEALKEKGVAEAILYERKFITAPKLETALGKKTFAEVADGLWEKKPGNPKLAPMSDKKPAYIPAQEAFKDVIANA